MLRFMHGSVERQTSNVANSDLQPKLMKGEIMIMFKEKKSNKSQGKNGITVEMLLKCTY